MKWVAQVRPLSSKLCKFCYVIKSFKDVTKTHVIRSIYFSYFRAHLRYGLFSWVETQEVKVF
jgi:hypothetical protein